jgi:AraC family transcriptional regulator, exoenzyme S synthesis regulatory protein ExsA
MEIVNLPQDISFKKAEKNERIVFYDYTAKANMFKGKSILHKNAISLVISGEKTMHFANKTIKTNSSEFHFLSAGNCIASLKLDQLTVFKSILIFFDNSILADFQIRYAEQIKQIKNQQKFIYEPYLAFKKDPFIYDYIDPLLLLFQFESNFPVEMKVLKFEELMLYLLKKYPEKILSFAINNHTTLNDNVIRKAVETNIMNDMNVGELAFLCNMSLSTFKRHFAKIYATSPSKWLLHKRMEMAKMLLLHHNEKPSDENHSSFTQAFKQTFGLTPKEFQLLHLNVKP